MFSYVQKMDSSSLPLSFHVIKEKNEQITSTVYETMLQQQTLQIFNLKTAAGSSKTPRSKPICWKEKCLEALLRSTTGFEPTTT